MISVTPLTTVALGHRAFHVAAADSGHIAALSREGIGSLLAPGQTSARRFDLARPIKGAAISPSGDLLALLEDDALSVIHLPDLVERHRLNGSFEGCLFSSGGELLWCAARSSRDMGVLEVRASSSCQVVARVDVPDPFEDSGLMLFSHPKGDQVALWIAGGQDGQCLDWACFDGSTLRRQRFPDLMDTAPPAFNRSGERFLVVSNNSVRLYQYPHGPELGRTGWPFEDSGPAESIGFVDEEHALIQSNEGRLFLIDLSSMGIVDEIGIQNHLPRPVGELFPNLRQDTGLCTDLANFMALGGGKFLSVHQELPFKSIAEWRDQLLIWKIPHFSISAESAKHEK